MIRNVTPAVPVTLPVRRRASVAALLGSAAFVSVGGLLVAAGEQGGWWAMVFALVLPVFAANIWRPDRLTLDRAGFRVRPSPGRTWTRSWDQVASFSGPPSRRPGTTVAFDDAVRRSTPPRTGAKGFLFDSAASGFLAQSFDLRPNEIAALMNRWQEAYGREEPAAAPAPAFAADDKGRLSVIDPTGRRVFRGRAEGRRVDLVRQVPGDDTAVVLLDGGRGAGLVGPDGTLVWSREAGREDGRHQGLAGPDDGAVLLIQRDRMTVLEVRTGEIVDESARP